MRNCLDLSIKKPKKVEQAPKQDLTPLLEKLFEDMDETKLAQKFIMDKFKEYS